MKKYLIILIAFLTLTLSACAENEFSEISFEDTKNFKTLGKVIYPNKEYIYGEPFDVTNINQFSNKVISLLFTGEENYVFSPISLYMALSMLSEGASGESLEEMKALLGENDLEKLSEQMKKVYEHNYYYNDYGSLRMANSIWINNDFSVKDAFIKKVQDKYYCESYHTSFDNEGKENIIKWINNYTNDLLKLTKDNYQINDNLLMLLLNTIYFDNKWETEFKKKDTYEDTFNTNLTATYMKHKVDSYYYSGTNYEIITDSFKNDNKIKFILPNEGVDVKECLTYDVLFKENKLSRINVNLSIPKFNYKNSYNLSEVLQSLGLNKMFLSSSDFSNIANESLFISEIKQDVAIELSEQGVKAAAVTSIGVKNSLGPEESVNIILNRPFIYIIYDNLNVPLFIGIIQNPNSN